MKYMALVQTWRGKCGILPHGLCTLVAIAPMFCFEVSRHLKHLGSLWRLLHALILYVNGK
jgi:hypothetical protein